MAGTKKYLTLKKRQGKFKYTWRKASRKIVHPYQKKIREEKLKIIHSEEGNVNVLDVSNDHSENLMESSHDASFNFTISHPDVMSTQKLGANNVQGLQLDNNSYLDESCRKLGNNNIINLLLRKMNEEHLLSHFMAFVDGIVNESISVSNISILLAMEYSYLMSLGTTTQMRYREETCKFWECVRNIGGPKLMRLFSSDKHFGKVISKECDKNKYNPTVGNFNFAVPDDKILNRSKTNIPSSVEPGIITDSIKLIDKTKQIVLSMDGKQTGKGLNNKGQGDVNLWGFEGPPSLQETLHENQREVNFFNNLALQLTDETTFCESAIKKLKFALQISSNKCKNLRESIVRHEILRSSFNNKIKKMPMLSSKYVLAFSEIDAFITRAKSMISKLLEINLKWCKIMSIINGNQLNFFKGHLVTLDDQTNSHILLDPQLLRALYGDNMINDNPELVKQRSEEWHELRK